MTLIQQSFTMTPEELQKEVEQAKTDPLVRDIEVNYDEGTATITIDREPTDPTHRTPGSDRFALDPTLDDLRAFKPSPCPCCQGTQRLIEWAIYRIECLEHEVDHLESRSCPRDCDW